jgi:hypothetical protein
MGAGDGNTKRGEQPTQAPPFDPETYARDSEHMLVSTVCESAPPTAPPAEIHARLRESCKDLRAALQPAEARGRDSRMVREPTLDAVVVLMIARADLEWFDLNPLAKTIAAAVDDEMIVEELLAVTHTDIAQGLAALEALAAAGVVAFTVPRDG